MAARNRNRGIWIVAGVVGALLIVAGLFWLRPDPGDEKQPQVPPEGPDVVEQPPPISPEEALRLVELRNLCLGYLENEELAECEPLLQDIIARLPDDPFGPRNLAVARLMMLEKTGESVDPAAYQSERDKAVAAVEMVRQSEGETAIEYVLRARIEETSTTTAQRAFAELSQAAALAPDEAWIAYELYQAGRFANDETIQTQAHAALRHAAELQPNNVWLLIELLPLLAEQQDAAMSENLQRFAEIVAPFASTIAAQTRIDPAEFLDQAQQAAAAGDWPTVLQRVRVVGNVLRPDPLAKADRLRLDRHPLEFVLPDFGADFAARADLPRPEPPEPISVRFAEASDGAPTGLAGVDDLHLVDFDLDGRPDVLAIGAERIAAVGRGDADAWTEIAAAEVADDLTQLLVADLDDDVHANATVPLNHSEDTICRHADPDAIAWGAGGLAVLENRLDAETGVRTIVAVDQDEQWQAINDVRAATLVDFDHDGDLDLAVLSHSGISLWSSRGNLTFENVSERSALPTDVSGMTALLAADWDRDLDADVLLVGESGIGMLENLRHGRLRYRRIDGVTPPSGARMWDFADLDNDQSWDLIAAGEQGLSVIRTHFSPAGTLEIGAPETVDAQAASQVATLDYDNDGFLDLITWQDERTAVYRGIGQGEFHSQPDLATELPEPIQSFASGDIDEDGDLDLTVTTAEGVRFIVNEGGNANRWIDVAARAQQIKGNQASESGRINHLGIGSTLVLRADGLDQTRLVRSEMTHFGLGTREQPDVVRILWTNGVPQNVIRPPANGEVCELQTLKGSCPYAYTWTGDRFEFFTDCLWASPLGLQFAEGVVAPWRAWEYLQIPAQRLKSDNGRYRLQITEELWEAAYFDEVRLIAVDHPADVEIFTNEKVGPAEIAEHKIFTCRQRRVPVAARDQRGRDVLPVVAEEDGNFLQAWDQKFRQGLTAPHSLELDLGALSQPQRITLYLTGWVYPSDTSINVALSQNPDLNSPRPPFLETLDEEGNWRESLPYMGFPGGKTKTIAVDVSNLFTNGDYRLRIGSTMEVRWDAVWFTVDEPQGEVREIDLELLAADLHFRGVSRHRWGDHSGPETYHYDEVEPYNPWPPMNGAFTRYGDVAPLLTDWDDRMVVMGAGDELSLEFAEPEDPPPDGWVRDLILYNVGWDKDADLNTVYGQSSEPLPFREMTVYPHRDGEARPVDPEYAEYLKAYQTRYQNRARFWKELPGLRTPKR